MLKRVISRIPHAAAAQREWFDLERIASVEMTSEDGAFPIEAALRGHDTRGWRAAESGVQTIRLIFDEPQKLRHVLVEFEETETKRTQEFTLRWSQDRGGPFQEIVRQQWNFSSPDYTRETEDYAVDLSNVRVLDLTIGEQQGSSFTVELAFSLTACYKQSPATESNAECFPSPAKHAYRTYTIRYRSAPFL